MEQPLGSGYVLEAPLGRGATGQVHRARRRDGARPLAVKVLRDDVLDDPDVVARFLQERSTLLALRSPYLVAVEDFVAEGRTLAIVMELVEDGDLRRLLRSTGALDPDRALRLVEEVLLGLCVVHGAGIIHRDVKPENVLLATVDGVPRAKLTDFGIARVLDRPAGTGLYDYLGTPGYQAPEIGRGLPTTTAADVYSVAVLLYELLVGATPFASSNGPLAVLHRQDTEQPTFPDSVPAPLRTLLTQWTSREPGDRPLHAAAALAALVPVHTALHEAGLPGSGPVPSASEQVAAGNTAETYVRPAAATTVPVRVPGPAVAASSRSDAGVPSAVDRPGRRGRRRLVLAAATALALAASGTAVALLGGQPSATASGGNAVLPFPLETYGDGAVSVSRTWALSGAGDHLHGELLVVARDAVHTSVDEVLPKSVATSASKVRFQPAPSKVVQDDPVVRFPANLKAGESLVVRYDATVAKGPRTVSRLQGWATDQYDAQTRYLATSQRTPPRTVASVALAPVLLPLGAGDGPHRLELIGTMSDGSRATGQFLAHATYASSAPGVASVDGQGVVQAQHDGAATVTATVGRLSAHATVTVTGLPTSTSTSSGSAPARPVKYVAPPLLTAPAAPDQVLAVPGPDGRVTVLWSAPSDGGSRIRTYTVYADGKVLADTATPHVVLAGLAPGRVVQFRVVATNGLGSSPMSAASAPVTVGAPPQTVCLPPQPAAVEAVPSGPTGARVTWALPAPGPGCRLTGFAVTSVPAGATAAAGPADRAATAGGLQLATAYAFQVTALFDGAPSQTSGRSGTLVTGLDARDAGALVIMPVPSGAAGTAVLESAPPQGTAGGVVVQPQAVVPPAAVDSAAGTPEPRTTPAPAAEPPVVTVPAPLPDVVETSPADPSSAPTDAPPPLDDGGASVDAPLPPDAGGTTAPTESAPTDPTVEPTTAPVEPTSPPVEETTPPVDAPSPPVEETTPPVEETTPPVVETTPPVVETTPPAEQTSPPAEPPVETTPPPDPPAATSTPSAPRIGRPAGAGLMPARETVRAQLPSGPGARIVIGRDPGSDVVVHDGGVSRRHAEVTCQEDGSWLLRDLGSSNGTFYAGGRVQDLEITGALTVHLGDEPGVAVRLDPPLHAALPAPVPSPAATTTAPAPARGLVVQDVRVRRAGKDLLAGVDVSFAPGELVAVLGPSGAGKSTFVKAVTGTLQPTSGRILLDGYDVHASPEVVRDLIGFVPQEDVLHPSLTVRQCLTYSAAIRLPVTSDRAAHRAAVERVVGQLGLTGHEDQRIDTLSGGQRKRVGTAIELLSQPSLLVLDEPTSGLDPHTERQVMDLLRDLATAGHTVLVVTHSPVAVQACDRSVVIARGALVYAGPTEGLPAHFRARSLGTVFAKVGSDEQGRWAEHWSDVLAAMSQPAAPVLLSAPAPVPVTAAAWRRQTMTTTRRNTTLLLADRANLALLVLGAPLLGLLVRLLDGDGLVPTGRPSTTALNVLLAAVLCAVWIGTFDAIREIVKERPVVDRERRAGLAVSAYVLGKVTVLAGLLLVQVVLLEVALLAGRPLPRHRVLPGPAVELTVVLFVTGLAAVAIALLVSALASSSDKALAAAPLLVVPQMVLAGALTDVHSNPVRNLATTVVTARWGLSTAASSVDLASLRPGIDQPQEWATSAATWASDLASTAGLGLVAVLALLLVLRLGAGSRRG